MAQEKHRKSEGEYGGDGEEAVDFLHCPCSRQQPAGTSALLLASLDVWIRAPRLKTTRVDLLTPGYCLD